MLLENWLLGHSLLVLLSLGTVFNLCWLWICRDRVRFSRWTVPLLAVLHTIFGVLSVRCMAFLETGSGGNMSLYGGMFLMPVFYGAVARAGKKKAADVFDVFTVCMLFTLLCARVNCIWKGCCAGLANKTAGDPLLHCCTGRYGAKGQKWAAERNAVSPVYGLLWRLPLYHGVLSYILQRPAAAPGASVVCTGCWTGHQHLFRDSEQTEERRR